jgi:hypothetical protein
MTFANPFALLPVLDTFIQRSIVCCSLFSRLLHLGAKLLCPKIDWASPCKSHGLLSTVHSWTTHRSFEPQQNPYTIDEQTHSESAYTKIGDALVMHNSFI